MSETAREIIDRLAERYEVPLPSQQAGTDFRPDTTVLDAATVAVHIWEHDDGAEWGWGPGYDAMEALEKALKRTP